MAMFSFILQIRKQYYTNTGNSQNNIPKFLYGNINTPINPIFIRSKQYIDKFINTRIYTRIYMDIPNMEDNATPSGIKNRGTGAGGANTNYYGKMFEEKTNNEHRLLSLGFTKVQLNKTGKKQYCLTKVCGNKIFTFVSQHTLKTYMKQKYDINIFRCPDEAYIVEHIPTEEEYREEGRKYSGKVAVKILEKKEQNVDGSVETKLWSAPSLKREYELLLGDNFHISYCFCLNDFLRNKLGSADKKYQILRQILAENNIRILFGDDANYFETLDNWIFEDLLENSI